MSNQVSLILSAIREYSVNIDKNVEETLNNRLYYNGFLNTMFNAHFYNNTNVYLFIDLIKALFPAFAISKTIEKDFTNYLGRLN